MVHSSVLASWYPCTGYRTALGQSVSLHMYRLFVNSSRLAVNRGVEGPEIVLDNESTDDRHLKGEGRRSCEGSSLNLPGGENTRQGWRATASFSMPP